MASLKIIAALICLNRFCVFSIAVFLLFLFSCNNEKNTMKQNEEIEQESEVAFTLKKKLKSARLHSIVEKEEREFAKFSEADKDNFYMPGVWHSSDCVGSGYSDLYVFYDDNTFAYYASQMACDKRLVSFSGSWTNNGSNLNISISQRIVLTGGKLIYEDGGSCGSDSVLVGAVEKTIKISPPEKKTIKLSNVYYEPEEDLGRKTMLFNGIRHWRISIYPKEFDMI